MSAFVHCDQNLERVWNAGRADAPLWHELTNSERYRLGLMYKAARAPLGLSYNELREKPAQ